MASESEMIEKKNQLQVFAPNLNLSEIKALEPKLKSLEANPSGASPISLLEWKKKELETAKAASMLAQSSYLPDFFLRFRQFNSSEMQLENQEVMIGFTLPFLYFWQPRAEVEEARANEMRAEAELKKEQLALNAKLSSLSEKEKSLKAQLENLKQKILPRSLKRTRLVKNVSQRTMTGLNQHNTVMLSHLDLKMKAVNLHLEYERLIKEIAAITSESSKRETRR